MAEELLPPRIRRLGLAAAGACLVPLLTQLQPVLALGFAALAVVAALSARPWPASARLLLLALMGSLVLVMHEFSLGRDTGSAGLAVLLAMKPLETHRLRDAHSLLGFSLFAPFAAFLQDQGPLVLCLSVPAVLLVLLALAALAEHPGSETTRRAARLPTVGKAVLIALPLALAGFWLFPRLGSPMWGMPENAIGRGGLADSMRPDQWIDLFADDAPALRVTFSGTEPTAQEQYWRAQVLWDFDGERWSRGAATGGQRVDIESRSPPLVYEVTLEPTDREYLVTLDRPLFAPADATLAADLTVTVGSPVASLQKYAMRSDPNARNDRELSPQQRARALALPPGRNPRTRALAEQWRAEAGDDDMVIIRRALRMITSDFSYSLSVPPTGRHPTDEFLFDSRVGFCQHFSSGFANLMRAAGIPTRVVIGYAGGYRNPYGGYWTVRRMDAHAWNEVWLPDRGWVRVDPTVAVAPERVLDTVDDLAQQEALLPESFAPLRDAGDWMRRHWNDLVVGFDAKRQAALLRPLGIDRASGAQLGIAFAVGAGLALALTLWLQMRGQPPQRDPLERAWLAFTRRLARVGLAKSAAEPPTTFAERAASALPAQADVLRALSGRYVAWRYGGQALDPIAKTRLVNELRGYRPTRPPRAA